MRLVTIVFTALSLGACHVEGPGSGEAKGSEDLVEEKDEGKVVTVDVEEVSSPRKKWAKPSDEWVKQSKAADKWGWYPINLSENLKVWVVLDRKSGKLSIQPIKFNSRHAGDHEKAGCIDDYSDLERGADGQNTTYQGAKPPESLKITLDEYGNMRELEYSTLDSAGNPVTHTGDAGLPDLSNNRDEMDNLFQLGFFLNGENCDHVSQSGEEGSGAPGGG